MNFLIPFVGLEIVLNTDFMCDSDYYGDERWKNSFHEHFHDKCNNITIIPKGAELKVSRVYIRTFGLSAKSKTEDFDSVTFKMTYEKRQFEFYLKLDDVCKLDFDYKVKGVSTKEQLYQKALERHAKPMTRAKFNNIFSIYDKYRRFTSYNSAYTSSLDTVYNLNTPLTRQNISKVREFFKSINDSQNATKEVHFSNSYPPSKDFYLDFCAGGVKSIEKVKIPLFSIEKDELDNNFVKFPITFHYYDFVTKEFVSFIYPEAWIKVYITSDGKDIDSEREPSFELVKSSFF